MSAQALWQHSLPAQHSLLRNKPLSPSKTHMLRPGSTIQFKAVMPAQAGIHREFHQHWE
jgi:hypothetical protein